MGIQTDLYNLRNYRKLLLHLTILTSIVASAIATSTIEPSLANTIPSSPSSPSIINLTPKEDMLVASPLSTKTSQPELNSGSQIVAESRPGIPYCDDSKARTIGRRSRKCIKGCEEDASLHHISNNSTQS